MANYNTKQKSNAPEVVASLTCFAIVRGLGGPLRSEPSSQALRLNDADDIEGLKDFRIEQEPGGFTW